MGLEWFRGSLDLYRVFVLYLDNEEYDKASMILRRSGSSLDARVWALCFSETRSIRKRVFCDDEVAWKSEATALYQALARRCEQSLESVELLADVEPTRKRISASYFKPLHRSRP